MGKSKKSQSGFSLEGRFLGYIVEDGYKIKQLRLATADGECFIKLSKEARAKLGQVLVPGDWVKVEGTKKVDSETELVKLKAYSVVPIVPTTSIKPDIRPSKSKQSILVCQKSGCMKRGGKAVCQALEMALSDRGLDDQVTIKGTGCMKNCGQGPNVIMPGKARYCKINAKEIPGLVDKHFPEVEPIEEVVEVCKLQPIA
ncbi:(2Fe-2S) ferredoxin domain-containing protein [Phormidesmis priestleyi]